MKKNIKRILVGSLAALLIIMSVSSAFAATIYYYFGYLYTNISNEKVSLYGIDDPEIEVLFVPASLNNKSVVDIRNNAFKDNTDFRSISFDGAVNLERIGSFAFSGCSAVTGEVKIPSNVTTVEIGAFQNCSSIESVVYNATNGSVPNQCFKGCSALSSVTLNDTVTGIGDYAFADCPSLEYLEIPGTVSSISDAAFNNDPDLIIGVYKDTVGHQYAVNNRIDHIVLDGDKLGDVTGDGVVDVFDATEIQKYAAESTDFTDEQFELGDINKDGFVDVIDALLVQKSVVGMYDIPENIIRY